jgi:hypothetical protein
MLVTDGSSTHGKSIIATLVSPLEGATGQLQTHRLLNLHTPRAKRHVGSYLAEVLELVGLRGGAPRMVALEWSSDSSPLPCVFYLTPSPRPIVSRFCAHARCPRMSRRLVDLTSSALFLVTMQAR